MLQHSDCLPVGDFAGARNTGANLGRLVKIYAPIQLPTAYICVTFDWSSDIGVFWVYKVNVQISPGARMQLF